MPDNDRELLIEAVASAWRPRDPYGRIESHPGWHDLDDSGRQEAYEVAALARAMEQAVDPRGLSATARAVLRRISSQS